MRILLVEHADRRRLAISELLSRSGIDAELVYAGSLQQARTELDRGNLACALVAEHLPDGESHLLLSAPQPAGVRPPLIVLLAPGGEARAPALLRAGFADYVPWSELTPARLAQCVHSAIRLHDAEQSAQRVDAEHRASQERFRKLFEQSPDAILVEDIQGHILDANPAACRLHDLPLAKLIGMNKDDLKPADRRDISTGIFARLVSGEIDHAEGTSWRRDGTGIPVEIRAARIEYAGKPAILMHLRDITHLRKAREELERQVAERTRDLVETNRKLQQEIQDRRRAEEQAIQFQAQLAHVDRLSTMGELATGLAHELNQPLGAIANYAHGSQRLLAPATVAPDLDAVREALSKIAAQADRAGQIIRRLRTFVAKGGPQMVRSDLHALLRDVVALMASDARRHGVGVELDLAANLPELVVDPIQFQQVLVNLMRNAMEAMAEVTGRPRLLLLRTLVREDRLVEVMVRDAGPPVQAEQMQRLFEAFYTTKSHGMGLGLSISRSIVEAHGGRLWAQANDDFGMQFHFTLPIV